MAANPIQYLKHGKALCGKVFRTFVETFNWHTAFCLNLKGDGDFPASQGKISLDRSNPDFPVIRCKGCASSSGGGKPDFRYWTFKCQVDPDTQERTGGWSNCQMQIGYNAAVTDKNGRITGTDKTDDGIYYAEVNLGNETAEVKFVGIDETIPKHDIDNGKVNIFVGKVEEGKQTEGIYCIPVAYKYI